MKMMLEKTFIAIYFLAIVSAFPHLPKPHHEGAEKHSKQNQDDDQETNLPQVFSDYYDYYNYDYYNYLDCNGDICVDGQEWFDVEKTVELDNSKLEVTEDEYFYVNTSSLWEECAPSVPLQGRLARFKSCQQWTEDYDNIFNSWYINEVCNFKKRMWLGPDGEIEEGKVGEMFQELEGFGEYLDSCIQWDGEWPDYYDYYDYYDYRVEKGDEKKGTKGKGKKGKSKKKQSKTKKRSGNKKKKGHKVGNKNKNKARKRGKNHRRKGKQNKTKNNNTNKKQRKKKKKKKRIAKKKNKGRRNQVKKTKKNNKKVNGMRYKREAAKDKKEKKKDKKKKKQKKQQKALNVIDLSALPTEQTIERLKCIEMSVFKKLDECGENILKNGLP